MVLLLRLLLLKKHVVVEAQGAGGWDGEVFGRHVGMEVLHRQTAGRRGPIERPSRFGADSRKLILFFWKGVGGMLEMRGEEAPKNLNPAML